MDEKRQTTFISINGVEAEVCESGGRQFFALPLEGKQIPQYRRKILENICCQALLPMHFLCERDILLAYYDFGGYVQLKDIYRDWRKSRRNLASETIETITAAARCAILAENYLFHCADFRMHPDTVFIRSNTGEVRLAYIPEAKEQTNISYGLATLVMDTVRIAHDEQWTVYAEEVYRRILSGNESISAIEKILHDKGREICGSQWPERSGLRQGELPIK